jgi:quercetin dioxygenase-like cupin family protein
MSASKYGKYIVTELKTDFSEEFNAEYAKWATRVLWMDNKVVEGAFQMNISWYLRPQTGQQPLQAHTHDPDEIIGFFGNNSENPYDLGGEIEFWLEDEKHIITRSSLIFVPGGMKHCPLILRRVDRPIFHFSTVTSGQYVLKVANINK